MRAQPRRAIIPVALALAAALMVALNMPGGSTGRVYSVAQVRAGLIHHPAAWAGRVVLVRGPLAYEGGGGPPRQIIVDQAARQRALLTLVVRRAPGVAGRPPLTPWIRLRAGLQAGLHLAARAPVVGPFIPVPANDGFTYRVRLLPKRPCASPDRCPEAVVLQVLP